MTVVRLPVAGLFDGIKRWVGELGIFESINYHPAQPDARPATRPRLDIWLGATTLVPKLSGLASTSLRIEWQFMTWFDNTTNPDNERLMIETYDQVMQAIHADRTLGGVSSYGVDLLGVTGAPLASTPAFSPMGGGAMRRVQQMTVPIVMTDVYEQSG